MCVYFLPFKTSLKIQEKKKKKKKKKKKEITVSREFSIREISNFGTGQLRDMGGIQW